MSVSGCGWVCDSYIYTALFLLYPLYLLYLPYPIPHKHKREHGEKGFEKEKRDKGIRGRGRRKKNIVIARHVCRSSFSSLPSDILSSVVHRIDRWMDGTDSGNRSIIIPITAIIPWMTRHFSLPLSFSSSMQWFPAVLL